jgi:hypothetical protein
MPKDKSDRGNEDRPVPPGAPDRTPVKEPREKKIPQGDPQSPDKKKKRL